MKWSRIRSFALVFIGGIVCGNLMSVFQMGEADGECAGSSCHVEASCMNVSGSHTCVCASGWTGDGITCADADECSGSNDCHASATCENTVGSYTCTCPAGYVGDGWSCADVDECSGNNGCHASATCKNTVGSYTCTCHKGFVGDGLSCSASPEHDVDSGDGEPTMEVALEPGGLPLVAGRIAQLQVTLLSPFDGTPRSVIDRKSPNLLEVVSFSCPNSYSCNGVVRVRADWEEGLPAGSKWGHWVVLNVVDDNDTVLATTLIFTWEVAFGPTIRMVGRIQEQPTDLRVFVTPYANYKWFLRQLASVTYYNIITVDSAKDADFVFASVHNMQIGPECLKYDPPPILLMWSGENSNWNVIKRPGMNVGWGHAHNENVILPRDDMTFYARYPYYFKRSFEHDTCFFTYSSLQNLVTHDTKEVEERWLARPHLAAYIARHGGYPREEVVMALDAEFGKDSVHRPSRNLNNKPNFNGTIFTYLEDFKFSIQLENAAGDGYITEKVFNALTGGAVPIWWGGNGTWQESHVIDDGRMITYTTKEKLYRDVHNLLEDDGYRGRFFDRTIISKDAQKATADMCYYAWDGVVSLLDDRLLGPL